ncbi:DUF308 domain-containing protein [Mucilaginibacter agri]|uniref:DUF308 domain-containing protein n=1 Tax=Mucilaginibacter agri TaxID=2695265 RepID=UPI001411FCC8|nr:DUF308 domain-containing protein [Mucilaginibacter agri]
MLTTKETTSPQITTARALRSLYITRTIFSVTWLLLVIAFVKTSPLIATVLLIIYPAWDVIGTYFDIKANKNNGPVTTQYVNAVISIITTVAVAIAVSNSVADALVVFGAWAILTGAIQLVLGLRRRKLLGGQWPMIISGGQSVIAGVSFIAMAHSPNMGIINLAGYAGFGAFYYLLAVISLSKSLRKSAVN